MKIAPDPARWRPLGRTANSDYFEIEPGLMACVPRSRSSDTEATARENAEFQERYWVELGRLGTCIVFFDQLLDQTTEARRVYATFPFKNQRATALVGGTLLSRAIASFFTGLSVPTTRTKFFALPEEAILWCRKVLAEDQEPR